VRLAKSRVHFIGIGGIGMCGLAELLRNMGAQVSGSDLTENAQTQQLQALGIKVMKGHAAENLGDAEVVVYSSAVRPNNPEFAAALKNKIPLIRRAEALAELMRLKRGIAVAGTHGKTTTTSLTASIFLAAQQDPTIVVGGRLDVIKSTAQLGKGEWLIAEADESDGTFDRLSPEVVIITNIDSDHLDHYGSFERLQEAFVDFASRIPFYGAAIVCGDNAPTRGLFEQFGKRRLFYGLDESNDYVLKKVKNGTWSIFFDGKKLVEFESAMPGAHNALNAVAAMIAANQAGIEWSKSALAIQNFQGVDRRFQHKGTAKGVDFYDDYGHHPTEILAVLNGFKEKFPSRRLFTVFQPHRFSRTQICWAEFLTAFKNTDRLFLIDIYAAGEAPIAGITTARLVSEIDHPDCHYVSREEDPLLDTVLAQLKPGDILLTLGAGDISKLGEKMVSNFLHEQETP
jgi:UDP-N-acetylmuramate--alanine ligase